MGQKRNRDENDDGAAEFSPPNGAAYFVVMRAEPTGWEKCRWYDADRGEALERWALATVTPTLAMLRRWGRGRYRYRWLDARGGAKGYSRIVGLDDPNLPTLTTYPNEPAPAAAAAPAPVPAPAGLPPQLAAMLGGGAASSMAPLAAMLGASGGGSGAEFVQMFLLVWQICGSEADRRAAQAERAAAASLDRERQWHEQRIAEEQERTKRILSETAAWWQSQAQAARLATPEGELSEVRSALATIQQQIGAPGVKNPLHDLAAEALKGATPQIPGVLQAFAQWLASRAST